MDTATAFSNFVSRFNACRHQIRDITSHSLCEVEAEVRLHPPAGLRCDLLCNAIRRHPEWGGEPATERLHDTKWGSGLRARRVVGTGDSVASLEMVVKNSSSAPLRFETSNGWKGSMAVSTEQRVSGQTAKMLAVGAKSCRWHTRHRFTHRTGGVALDVSETPDGGVVLELEQLGTGVDASELRRLVMGVCQIRDVAQ